MYIASSGCYIQYFTRLIHITSPGWLHIITPVLYAIFHQVTHLQAVVHTLPAFLSGGVIKFSAKVIISRNFIELLP